MQRGRHVDGVRVAFGTLEPYVFRGGIGADELEEIGKLYALPRADRTPAFDANVTRDLGDFRQLVEFRQRPRLLVVDQAANFELPLIAVDIGRLVLAVI